MVPANYGTPQRIITTAYREAGKIARDQTPDSGMLLDGMNRLADVLYYQQTQGLKLWLLEDISVPIVAGTALYTFGPAGTTVMRRPFRVEFGYAADSSGNRREIDPLSYQDYSRLSNITQTGQVTQYFVDKQLDTLNVYLWLVPDADQVTGSVNLVMRTKAAHLETLTEAMTFPPEWYLALLWEMANQFSTGQPIAVQQRCAMMSDRYIQALQDWDIEDVPMQIQANFDQTTGGAFR